MYLKETIILIDDNLIFERFLGSRHIAMQNFVSFLTITWILPDIQKCSKLLSTLESLITRFFTRISEFKRFFYADFRIYADFGIYADLGIYAFFTRILEFTCFFTRISEFTRI